MESLKTTKKLVERTLEGNPKARNSDTYLYYVICKAILKTEGIDIDKISFKDGLLQRKQHNLPNFETVRRTRQKLQQERPELAGTEEVEAMRSINEEAFRNFARGL